MKKGRHRRYEEARALKRGGDLDIEAIFNDLETDRPAAPRDDVETDPVLDSYVEDEDVEAEPDEEWERG